MNFEGVGVIEPTLRDVFESTNVDEHVMQILEKYPPGHPERATVLDGLARGFFERHSRTDADEDLQRTIRFGEELLELHPPGHPERPETLANLSGVLATKCDFERAVELQTEALELCPLDDSARSEATARLAVIFSLRYRHTDSPEDLEKAMRLNTEISGHMERAPVLESLAGSFTLRHSRTGADEDRERAIGLCEAFLELHPRGRPERRRTLVILSGLLSYKRDFERAIELQTEALELYPRDNPAHSNVMAILAELLSLRYRHTESLEDLEKAVQLNPEVSGHATVLKSLADGSLERHSRSRADEYRERTIELCEALLELHPRGHPERRRTLVILSGLVGSKCDFERAIQLQAEALELFSLDDPVRSPAMAILAVLFSRRYHQTGFQEDLEKAIQLNSKVLELYPPGHPQRLMALKHLAHDVNSQYSDTKSLHDLERVIELFTELLEYHPQGHERRDAILKILIGALRSRYEHSRSRDDLETMIGLLTETLQLQVPGTTDRGTTLHLLAGQLALRYIATHYPGDIDRAIELSTEALAEPHPPEGPHRGTCLGTLVTYYCMRYDLGGDSRDDEERVIELLTEILELHSRREAELPDTDIVRNMEILQSFLHRRYNRTGSIDDLKRMIELGTEIVERYPPEHSNHLESLNGRASSIGALFQCTGAEDVLLQLIDIRTRALGLCPPGHPDRPSTLNHFASAIGNRYKCTGSQDDLVLAIDLQTEVLQLCPPEHVNRAEALNNLAMAIIHRYKCTGSQDDLVLAIGLHTEALQLRPPGHVDRAESLSNLAMAVVHRYECIGSQDDLVLAIDLYTEVLELIPLGHQCRAEVLDDNGTVLSARYNYTGSRDDLVRAIELFTEALLLRPPGHVNRIICLNNLAASVNNRYECTGSQDDLVLSINLHTEALKLRPPGHPDHVLSLNNLACSITHRYECTGSQDDLVLAIDLYTEALSYTVLVQPGREKLLNNLAVLLRHRYRCTESKNDLLQAIELHTAVLELCPPGHPGRPGALVNLAGDLVYRSQYNYLPEHDDLAMAIRLYTDALELFPPAHLGHTMLLHCLASSLHLQYDRTRSRSDLERMIDLLQEALQRLPVAHQDRGEFIATLAQALSIRYRVNSSLDDLAKSIELLYKARELHPIGHRRHAATVCRLVDSLSLSHNSPQKKEEVIRLLKEGSTDPVSPLDGSFECARRWVALARESDHSTIGEAYDQCIRFLRLYLTIGPTMKLQYDFLQREPEILAYPMDAAAHAVEHRSVERAVELFDEGRSLLWSDMGRFRAPLLSPALEGNQLGERFDSICRELRATSTAEAIYDTGLVGRGQELTEASTGISYDVLITRKRKLLKEYDEIVALIRTIPHMGSFQKPTPFAKLQQSAKEGPVIIVNCSKFGSHVIIVFANRLPSVLPLDSDVNFYEKAVEVYRLYIGARIEAKDSLDMSRVMGPKLATVCRQLWHLVASRVVDELTAVGIPRGSRIWWSPTSFLMNLPLHAAGDGRKFLMDSYISSYTPTLKALIDARQSSTSPAPEDSGPNPRLLVVAQTETKPELPSAKAELGAICEYGLFVKSLDNEDATHTSVLELLHSHNWVHFICHGSLAPTPFDSALHLRDTDMLSLNDVVKANLPDAKFAFLSACHTADQMQNVLADETLHLSAAMQYSGFRSVVGTMWEMADIDGPYVAKEFYKEMFRDDYRARIARWLGKALQGLKGNRTLLGRLLTWFAKGVHVRIRREDDDAEERHRRAARALWMVTRGMSREVCPWKDGSISSISVLSIMKDSISHDILLER